MSNRWKVAVAAGMGILLGAAFTSLLSQDRLAVAPDTRVLLDNEHVRVVYHDLAPGQVVPFHSHPPCVAYSLKPYRAKLKVPDGTERIVEGDAGEAFWSDATTHSVENLGPGEIHNLVVELKHAGAAQPPGNVD